MIFFFYPLIFILGACTISFLKVIAHDYPELSLTRRSHCDRCLRILRWYEIIPIIGYFIVNGKCSRCKNQIDFANPLLEFCGGLLFCIIVFNDDLIFLPFILMLILLGFCDYLYGYVYPIFYLLSLPTIILNFKHLHFLVAVLIYLTLLLLNKFFPLGLGDVEVIAFLGLIFEIPICLDIVTLACASCIANYLLHKKRSFRFIPYLTIATGIIYLIFSIRT